MLDHKFPGKAQEGHHRSIKEHRAGRAGMTLPLFNVSCLQAFSMVFLLTLKTL